MDKMLKADYFRMFKSKSTYVLPIVAFLLVLLQTLITSLLYSLSASEGAVIPPELQSLMSALALETVLASPNAASAQFLIALFCCLFVASDFSGGTMRLQVASGENRVKIYFARIITLSTYAVAMMLFAMLCGIIIGAISMGFGKNFTGQDFGLLMRSLGIYCYVAIGYVSLYTMLASLLREVGRSICVSIFFFIVLSLLFTLLTLVNADMENIAYYMLPQIEEYAGSTVSKFDTAGILRVVLVPFVYIVVTNGIGLLAFVKRDVK